MDQSEQREAAAALEDPRRGVGPTGGRARKIAAVLLLLVLPGFLRLWPIEHGAPRQEYVPDTHVVRNALHMAKDRDLVPPGGAFSTYPYLLAYTLVPVYAADFVAGKVAGTWEDGTGYGDHLREQPFRAHRLARIVFALIASLAPLLLYFAARAAGLGTGAWVAGWLAATCLLHVQLSLHERPWGPMMTPLAASLWAAIVHVRTGARRPLILSALAAGIAGAMHQGGMPFLGLAGLAWFLAPREGVGSFPTRVVGGVLAVATFGLVVLLLGHPYVLIHGPSDAPAAGGEFVKDGMTTFQIGGQQIQLWIRWASFPALAKAFVGYDPAVLLLGLAGLVATLRRRAFLVGSVFALGWGAFFMTNGGEHTRYLLPMAMLLTLPAGYAVERFATSAPLRIAAVALLALPLLQAMRLGAVLRQPDTRAVAEAKLLAELPRDARVAIDVYGPIVPRSRDGLMATDRLRDLYAREAFRAGQLEADTAALPGIDAVRIEDAMLFDPRHRGSEVRTLPGRFDGTTREPLPNTGRAQDVLTHLGATHVLLVDRTPDDGHPPLLVDPFPSLPNEFDGPGAPPVPKLEPLELGPALWQVHPAWEDPTTPEPDTRARDAHLPQTLRFPLIDLWRVRRPGPALSLHELTR